MRPPKALNVHLLLMKLLIRWKGHLPKSSFQNLCDSGHSKAYPRCKHPWRTIKFNNKFLSKQTA